jgi:hypothetical protein
MSTKRQFRVGVPEVFITWVTVEAESIDKAKQLAKQKVESGKVPESEYSHTLDKDTWTIVDDQGNFH